MTVTEKFTVTRCRELLGAVAVNKTDTEVELLRDQMFGLALFIIDDYKARRASGTLPQEFLQDKPVDGGQQQTYAVMKEEKDK